MEFGGDYDDDYVRNNNDIVLMMDVEYMQDSYEICVLGFHFEI